MKKVFLSIGADFIHGGHIAIIKKAAELGELTVGVLTDEAIMSYRPYPILSFEERVEIVGNIAGVSRVIPKNSRSYEEIIKTERPDIVVHGDGWRGRVREQLIELLNKYGGELVEFPYTNKTEYQMYERHREAIRHMPDMRRGMLKRLLEELKRPVRVMEAHNGLTGLIVEKTRVEVGDEVRAFDAIWVSSLCDSTSKGKPDIELVDMTSRMNTINEIMEVTTKPIILDADTGGLPEHFEYNVRTVERLGVSAVIIEDKMGLKKNSLFGNEVRQQQASIEDFCEKIRVGKRAQQTKEFMIIARIESLILEQGMNDAMERAKAYVKAGADGIMIHSRSREPDEVTEFCSRFREIYPDIPVIVVPTTYNTIREYELYEAGINVVIYANQLIRSAFPAMKETAELILKTQRGKEADEKCMSIKEILTLI